MDFDTLVFAGRFAPFTLAHQSVVTEALKRAPQLILLVGSSYSSRTQRTPWTFSERREMIMQSLLPGQLAKVVCLPIPDFDYADHLWVKKVNELVAAITQKKERIGLIGHEKDATSYYLRLFPKWGSIDVANFENVDATTVRDLYFSAHFNEFWRRSNGLIPPAVFAWLKKWWQSELYDEHQGERDFCANYKTEWGEGPFMTADAVCVQAGHVLMIRRGDYPGKGLWALPGGFMNKGETLLTAAIRELKEETQIDMPAGAIRGSLAAEHLFDNPHRDPRARVITQAFLFNLDREMERKAKGYVFAEDGPLDMTQISAASDAAHAEWIPLNELDSSKCFADHFHVIQKMIGLGL